MSICLLLGSLGNCKVQLLTVLLQFASCFCCCCCTVEYSTLKPFLSQSARNWVKGKKLMANKESKVEREKIESKCCQQANVYTHYTFLFVCLCKWNIVYKYDVLSLWIWASCIHSLNITLSFFSQCVFFFCWFIFLSSNVRKIVTRWLWKGHISFSCYFSP